MLTSDQVDVWQADSMRATRPITPSVANWPKKNSSVVSDSLRRNLTIDQVQKFLGHLHIATTQIYAETSLRALATGELPVVEPLAAELEALPLVLGADGGRGLWSVFQRLFQGVGVTAILDFYHAAQNLYKGASAWRNWLPWSRGHASTPVCSANLNQRLHLSENP